MNRQRFALRRPFTVLVMIAGVVLAAFYGLTKMSRDIFPPLGIPTIYVAQPYGGMDPAQMEGFLTYYYEYHFLYITGIEHVESKSIQGAAILKLQFHPGTDMSQAMAETVSYVNRARAFMPVGTVSPFVTRFDTGSVPVGDLVFSSPTKTVGQIQDLALNTVRPLFATLPGVSAPPPFGGSARTIVVTVDPTKMEAYNLSPDEVVAAMANADVISPSGNVSMGSDYPMVPVNSIVRDIHELEAVPVRTGAFPSVFVRDIAKVSDGSDILTSVALADGRPTVYIPVTKRADASTLSVVNLVKANMAKFQSVLPDDVTVSYQFDQSPFVTRAINGLATEAGLGALLTGLVVLLFLGDWRSALIVVLNIPISLLGAVFALWLSGETINIMTLGGLAVAVGILVDESTVVIENINTHFVKHSRETVERNVLKAGHEVVVPRLIAMLCVVAVFLPSFAMEGAARALFVPLSLAVGFSMAGSYFLGSMLVPILSVWAFRSKHASGHYRETDPGLFGRLRSGYAAFLRPIVAGRWLIAGAYFAAAGFAIYVIVPQLGTEIFPQVSAGQIQLRITAPAGTRLDRTVAYTQKALDEIKQEVGPNNVGMSLALAGVHGSNYPVNFIYLWNSGPQQSVLQVQLKDGFNPDMSALRERLRARFAKDMPDVQFSFEPSDIVSRVMSFGSPTPIEVAVMGTNLNTDRDIAEKVRQKLAAIPVLRDVQFEQPLSYPTVAVSVDRERAGLLGITADDVTRALTPATSSSRFTRALYWPAPNTGVTYQIQVELPQTDISSLQDIGNVPVDGAKRSVLLRNVANVATGTAVGEYDRYNGQRVVSVSANIEGADLGHVAAQVQKAMQEIGALPKGTTLAIRGQIQPLNDLFSALQGGLIVAVVVIFLVLIANFESLALALITISTVPAVIAGVALSLLWWHTSLNLQSYMGAIMAVGVAIANAILLVSFAERSRRAGASATDAAREGAASRLRPILMSSFAMIAGMMPMALGLGQGGDQSAPLGRAVVGGLAFATIATLVVLPAIFALIRGRAHRRSSSLDPDDPTIASAR